MSNQVTNLEKNRERDRSLVSNLLQQFLQSEPTDDAEKISVLDTNTAREEANASYSKILKTYEINLEKNLKNKLEFKKEFFDHVMNALNMILIVFVITLFCSLMFLESEKAICAVIGVVVSFLSTYIALPTIVAKY